MRRVLLSAASVRPPAQPVRAAARFATSDSAPQFASTADAAAPSPTPAQQQAASAPEHPPHPYEVLVEHLMNSKFDEFKEGFRAGIVEKKIPPLLSPILELYAKKCDAHNKKYRVTTSQHQGVDAVALNEYLNELKEAGLYKESFPDIVPLIPYHKEFEDSFAAFDLVLKKIRNNATRLSPTQEIFIEEAATQVFKAITAFHSEAQVVEFIQRIVDRLSREGIHLTPFHFSRAISLLKRLGGLETLDKVWDMMTRCGARPNSYAYTDYIAACGFYVRGLRGMRGTPLVGGLSCDQREQQIRDAIRKAESKFDEGVRRGEQLTIATSLMMKIHQHDVPASEAFVQKLNKNPRCQGYLLIATNALQRAQEPQPASPF